MRIAPDEFDRRKDRGHDVRRACWAALFQILVNGSKVSGRPAAVPNPHRTPQRFQNGFICSSLTKSPRSSSAIPSRIAVSSSSSTNVHTRATRFDIACVFGELFLIGMQNLRAALTSRGFRIDSGTMREDGCVVLARRSEPRPLSKAA